jgi:hypothetical protein
LTWSSRGAGDRRAHLSFVPTALAVVRRSPSLEYLHPMIVC